MKQVYSNIRTKAGAQAQGIFKLSLVPREWLINEPIIDFATGKVITPINLLAGRNWLVIDLTPDSYKYSEPLKQSKAGAYYDITIAGTLCQNDPLLQQTLESLRYHECVVIVSDRNKRHRLIGDKNTAPVFGYSDETQNSGGGSSLLSIALTFQTPDKPPFYEL